MEIHWEGPGRQVIFFTQRVNKGNKKSILKRVDKKLMVDSLIYEKLSNSYLWPVSSSANNDWREAVAMK